MVCEVRAGLESIPKWDWFRFGKGTIACFAGVLGARFQFGNYGSHDWAIVLTGKASETHIDQTLSKMSQFGTWIDYISASV